MEDSGGMTKYIESGNAKLRIEEAATKKQARIDSKEDVVVGVNKYKNNDKDHAVDVLSIDNTAVRESQVNKLRLLKAERNDTAVAAALAALKDCAEEFNRQLGEGRSSNNLLKLAVDAARVRCTLGNNA